MATLINKILCAILLRNTGICDCFFDPKNPTGMIFVPQSFKITAANLATIQSYLEGKTRAPKGSRIFPIQNFVSINDGTEDPTVESFAFGQKETVREGNYSWTFGFRKGGVSLSNKLRSFNGKEDSFSVLFIDAQNAIYGTSFTESNGDTSIKGIPLSRIYTSPWKVNDGSKNTGYMINVEFAPIHVNEKLAFAKVEPTDYLLTELTGLQDINLKQALAPAANGVFTVSVNTDCGENLFDTYGTPLASPALWLASNKATGANIPVTSVVVNEGLKAFTVTLAHANPAYPGAGGSVNITLLDPEALATGTVVGFEADVLTQVRA